MRKSVFIVAIFYLFSVAMHATEPKKPSVFSRIKGFLGKKKEEPKPKDTPHDTTVIKFITSLCIDLKEFFKTGSEQIAMFKNHPKVIRMVQQRITQISQQKEATTDEELARLTGQLDRLCAAPFSSFVELLQKVRLLTNHLQQLFDYTQHQKELGVVKEWLSKCDGVLSEGNTLVEQLMKQKGKDDINDYIRKASDISKSYKTTLSNVMNSIQKIRSTENIESKIPLDYPTYLGLIPDKLEELVSLCSHVAQITTQMTIVVKNTQIESKVAQTEIKQESDALDPVESYRIDTIQETQGGATQTDVKKTHTIPASVESYRIDTIQETQRGATKISDPLTTQKATNTVRGTQTGVKKTTVAPAPLQSYKVDTIKDTKRGSYKIDTIQETNKNDLLKTKRASSNIQETQRGATKISDLLTTQKATNSVRGTQTGVKKTTVSPAPLQSYKIDTIQDTKRGSYKIDTMQDIKTQASMKTIKAQQETLEKETKKLEQEVTKAENGWGSVFNGIVKGVGKWVPTFW